MYITPPLLALRLKIFNLKFTTSPGIEPQTHWTRGIHATISTHRDEECCPQVLSFFMTMLGRILPLQQRGSWNVYDGKCLITHHHPPALGFLWFSSLSSYETVVVRQHSGTMSCRPEYRNGWKHKRLTFMTRVLESWYHAMKSVYVGTLTMTM